MTCIHAEGKSFAGNDKPDKVTGWNTRSLIRLFFWAARRATAKGKGWEIWIFSKDRVKPLYFHYLAAAFGSALTSSNYSVVDMAMVGQYQGPDGTAALAVVAPVWNII